MNAKPCPIASHKSFEILIRLYFQQEVIGTRSPLTVEAKKYDFKRFLTYFQEKNGTLLSVDQWHPLDTRSFVGDMLGKGLKPATINRTLASLRAFANWLEANGKVTLNPCKGVPDLQLEPLPPRAIRDREWYRVQKTAALIALSPQKRYSQGYRNRAMLVALNASGLRISELLNLRVSQFIGRRFVDVMCKGAKIRTILITQEAADLVRQYVQKYRTPGSDFLFTNRYGMRLSRNGIGGALHKIAAHANVSLASDDRIELRPHLIRHRHAYKARSAHGDVFAAKRLGHSSLRHLERYAGLTEQEESELLQKM